MPLITFYFLLKKRLFRFTFDNWINLAVSSNSRNLMPDMLHTSFLLLNFILRVMMAVFTMSFNGVPHYL